MTKVYEQITHWPVCKLKNRGKLIITQEVKSKIDQLHQLVGKTEWCGFLMYKKVAGKIAKPQSLIFETTDIYQMDIGNEVFTESKNPGSDIISMDKRCPNYIFSRTGLIHTHHNMDTFFSPQDVDELHRNVEAYSKGSKGGGYYISLIVNFQGDYKAKVVKLISTGTQRVKVTEEDGVKSSWELEGRQVMIEFDLDIEIENTVEYDVITERYNEIVATKLAEKEAKEAAKNVTKEVWDTNTTSSEEAFPGWVFDEHEGWVRSDPNDGTTTAKPFSEGNKQLTMQISMPWETDAMYMRKFLSILLTRDDKTVDTVSQAMFGLTQMSEIKYDEYKTWLCENIVQMIADRFKFNNLDTVLEFMWEIMSGYCEIEVYQEIAGELVDIFAGAQEVQT